MKRKKKPEAPAAPAQQESLFLWVDPTTIAPARWTYGARLPRDRWAPTGGLALRGRRIIAWTVQLDDGGQVELRCVATLLRREIRELGRRGEIHIRLVDQSTLTIAIRNPVSQRDGMVVMRLLVERPQSGAERAAWCERVALYNGLREPGPAARTRRYPVRNRGPRSRQRARKVPDNERGYE